MDRPPVYRVRLNRPPPAESGLNMDRPPACARVRGLNMDRPPAGASSVSCFHTVIYKYYFINTSLNWNDAQQYCRQHYTDLITFWSLEDVNRVERPSDYGGFAWIGLFDDPASWKGIMGNDANSWRWSATGMTNPGGYQKWANGEPSYSGGNEQCVTMTDGVWLDKPCVNLYRFACFTGQKNYTLVTQIMNWENARRYCREHHTDLAMIEDEIENTAVSSLAPQYYKWIGLYREPWRWSDGSQSSFKNWVTNAPDSFGGIQPCTREQSTYQWNDSRCSDKYPFICQKSFKSKETRIMMKFLSDVEAEFQRKGITDVRLTWKSAHP
ncbi:hypothetical protein WMY93_027022 [Mugilogobius chulae]|uniref:C-type lectin domain-containing protein n=1 Tax=Mugilogobius chulae TaxID=88201 RepID=A0AAW0MRS9_9GOBI